MPPKLSKADREKLKREEAERKAREEEEQHQAEEAERLAQEETKRVKREEQERVRAEEQKRCAEERQKLEEWVGRRRESLAEWKRDQLQKKQWANYLSCSELPDPTDEKALNMYLRLYEEESGDQSIEHTLQRIGQCLEIGAEVERLLAGDGLPPPTEDEIQRYQQTLARLHSSIQHNLDLSTLHYLEEAEKHVDPETYNLRVEAQTPGVLYCLWGNVVKNPRLKDFSFHRLPFSMDIPKPLLLANAAVRLLRLTFDPLSPLSRSYHCTFTPSNTGSPSIDTRSSASGAMGDAPDDLEDNEAEEEEERGVSSGNDGGASVRVGSAATNGAEDRVSTIAEGREGGGGGEGGEGEDALPTSSVNGEGVKGEEATGEGENELEEDEIDLRAFRPASGPLLFELLEMPPPAKVTNNWTIRKVVSQSLTTYPYPAEALKPQQKPSVTATDSCEDQPQASAPPALTPGSSLWPAINITMQLPTPYLFSEEPHLARWCKDMKAWRTEGLKNVTFDLEERTVSFQTFYFSPVAVMTDLYVNMPYQSWELLPRPGSPDHAHLGIVGGAVEIGVDIQGGRCTLVGPTEEPAVEHLLNRAMSARELIEELKKVGVNFFPEPDGHNYVSVTDKNPSIELSVYQHMALAAPAFAFSWSQWNGAASRNKFILKACECLKEQSSSELPWSLYAGGHRSRRLKMSEDGSEFSMDREEGTHVHADLYSTLENGASPKAQEIMRGASPIHTEALVHWLTATRILTYS